MARPGTPTWTVLQTQPPTSLVEQVACLSGSAKTGLAWQDEQIRLLTFAALAGGVRGICFQSQVPLTGRRSGHPAPRGPDGTDQSRTRPDRAVVRVGQLRDHRQRYRSRVGRRRDADRPLATRAAAGRGAAEPIRHRVSAGGVARYIVPGVPESNDAYELTPAGLRPVAHKRVAGGISVVLPDGEQGSLIVLTQDPLVISESTRRVAQVGRRAAVLKQELANLHLARVEQLEPQLSNKAHSTPTARSQIEAGRANLKQAEARLAQGGYEDVYLQSRRADQAFYQVERACWEKITLAKTASLSVPLGVACDTLPEYWQFVGQHSGVIRGINLLPTGKSKISSDAAQRLAAFPAPANRHQHRCAIVSRQGPRRQARAAAASQSGQARRTPHAG